MSSEPKTLGKKRSLKTRDTLINKKTNKLLYSTTKQNTMPGYKCYSVNNEDGSFAGFIQAASPSNANYKLRVLFPHKKYKLGVCISDCTDRNRRVSKYTWSYVKGDGRFETDDKRPTPHLQGLSRIVPQGLGFP